MLDASIPAHVPQHRVRDFDFLGTPADADLHLWFKQLHQEPDLFYTPRNGGHWVATRYTDMETILASHADFSSEHSTLPREGKPMRVTLLESDEPLHTDYRRLVQPFLTPKKIGELERRAREISVELIEGFLARGECEFVGDFALKMPLAIFMGMIDLPASDREYLHDIVVDLVRGKTVEAQMGGFQRSAVYLAQKYAERRARPGPDILSALVQGQVDGGRPMRDDELLGIGALLLAGGLDTVAALLSYSMNFLANSPEHRRQLLEQPERIAEAADELMRRFHVVNIARVVIRDMDFQGVALKAGDAILIPTVAAGLDEQRFHDPMRVDFNRADKRSLIFGRGIHQCIGMLLARAEMRVFLEEWFARIPHFIIKPCEKPLFASGRATGAVYLPLSWQAM